MIRPFKLNEIPFGSMVREKLNKERIYWLVKPFKSGWDYSLVRRGKYSPRGKSFAADYTVNSDWAYLHCEYQKDGEWVPFGVPEPEKSIEELFVDATIKLGSEHRMWVYRKPHLSSFMLTTKSYANAKYTRGFWKLLSLIDEEFDLSFEVYTIIGLEEAVSIKYKNEEKFKQFLTKIINEGK